MAKTIRSLEMNMKQARTKATLHAVAQTAFVAAAAFFLYMVLR